MQREERERRYVCAGGGAPAEGGRSYGGGRRAVLIVAAHTRRRKHVAGPLAALDRDRDRARDRRVAALEAPRGQDQVPQSQGHSQLRHHPGTSVTWRDIRVRPVDLGETCGLCRSRGLDIYVHYICIPGLNNFGDHVDILLQSLSYSFSIVTFMDFHLKRTVFPGRKFTRISGQRVIKWKLLCFIGT